MQVNGRPGMISYDSKISPTWTGSDIPPNSLMVSIVNPNVKTMKGKGVGTCSLARSISRVEGVLEFRDGIKTSDKRVNYSHESAQTKQQVG
jgi:hypothetical protein